MLNLSDKMTMRLPSLIFLFLFSILPVVCAGESFAETKAKAEAGDPKAQTDLGHHYRVGSQQWLGDGYNPAEGVRKDGREAIKWYLKAANQGHVGAQFSLGALYIEGTSVIKNYSEAAKWFKKAAEQGHSLAQLHLGHLYEQGKGVSKNMKEAAIFYQKAAYSRSAPAQLQLGECYESGSGVSKNYVEAYALFNLVGGAHWEPWEEAKARVARKMSRDQIEAAKKRTEEIRADIIQGQESSQYQTNSP